jgi:asparagine synthetase B (glutamine-hydrolysing)
MASRKTIGKTLRKVSMLPGFNHNGHLRKIINAFDASLAPKKTLPLQVIRLNNDCEIDKILMNDWKVSCKEDEIYQFLMEGDEGDPISRAQRLSFRYFMPDAYLPKVDRMSMAASLEVRVPFLDRRLVEYAVSLPGNLHWSKGVGKQLLRRAVSDLLPKEIFTHKKQGFSIPLHRWMTDEYFELVEELLNERAVSQRGLLDSKEVRLLIDRCQGKEKHLHSQESDYRLSHRLFMLVILEIWCVMYLDAKATKSN